MATILQTRTVSIEQIAKRSVDILDGLNGAGVSPELWNLALEGYWAAVAGMLGEKESDQLRQDFVKQATRRGYKISYGKPSPPPISEMN